MSGMPPGMAPAFSRSGASATMASVVRMFFAIEAAFCSAERVTMAGSMMPALIEVDHLAGVDVQAEALLGVAHVVHDHGALEPGVRGELAQRLFERALDDALARGLVVGAVDRRSPRRRP